MGLGSILRTSARYGLGIGAVAMYYEAGLWKSADETIKNYDNIKRDINGLIDSTPVVREVITDVANYGINLVSPVTDTVSDVRRNYLNFDMSWTQNADGIVKPAWNKAVAVTCDFMAHSPKTIKEATVSGYNKATDYMNSAPLTHTTTTVSATSVETSESNYCSEPLLYRASLSATSQLPGRSAEDARLDSGTAWAPAANDFREGLIIDLHEVKNVTQILTKGRAHSQDFIKEFTISFGFNGLDYAVFKENDGNAKYVEEYELQYSSDGTSWKNAGELFEGNRHGDQAKVNRFETPIIAQYIRINPTRWGERISMRIELYGCDYVSETLSFNGSALVYKNLTENRIQSSRDIIQFRLRTTEADGVLIYAHGTQGDVFALQLYRNRMILNINLGSETTSISSGSLLDDGLWHDVRIDRRLNRVSFTIDRVELKTIVKGDFQILDLDKVLYIGGVPNSDVGLSTAKNFTGCLENFYLNETNVISVLREEPYYESERFYSNHTFHQCPESNIVPVTFTKAKGYLKLPGFFGLLHLNVSFDFRTFEPSVTLLFHKFSSPGYIKVYTEKGKILVDLEVENSPRLTLENFVDRFDNGLWHSLEVTVGKNRVTLSVDERMVRTSRLMDVVTGDVYFLGGVDPGFLTFNSLQMNNMRGFIGCVRQISVDGAFRNPKDFKEGQHFCCDDAVVIDACQMMDRCSPNPCEHGGKCQQTSSEFECDCTETGYTGATCYSSLHPTSCEAYRNANPGNQRAEVTIDPDGSGPLDPFRVACQYFTGGPTETHIRHSSAELTEIDGYQENGSFSEDIIYDGNFSQIDAVVNRSSSCKQMIEYRCRQSRLFNSPYDEFQPFHPTGWWVSRQNQMMDYWGNAPEGSRKCECGVLNSCVMENTWCNCDGGLDAEVSDGGWLTEKQYLPVKQVRFGDTGTLLDDKKGKFSLGALICEGNALYDNVITFRLTDAALTFPAPELGHSWDIYFEFKTTALNAVFLHVRGPQDYIKVGLINGHQVQFEPHLSSQVETWTLNVKTSNRLNDDEWHSVLIEQNRKQARIVVDGSASDTRPQAQGHVRTMELTSKFFLGTTTEYREGYVGCMRAVTVNGVFLDLKMAVERQEYGVGMGCTGRCESNPCLNNGTCTEGYNTYTCDCRFTSFKGPICADEIGVNMQSHSMVRFDFIGSYKSTIAEKLRVGFTTTDPKGFLVGIFSNLTGEYMTLMVSNSGHLRLVFDFGFERQEIIYPDHNFATGQYHDVQLTRANSGTKFIIKADNLEPYEVMFNVKASADAQFNNIEHLYLGRNESMREGFIGCISRVQFDDQYPLKYLFQENPPNNIQSTPPLLQEDFCGVEPVTHPPEIVEIRPPPDVDESKIDKIYFDTVVESAVLGGVLTIIFIGIIIMCLLIGRYLSQHKGEYLTQEDEGAADAADPNEAAVHGVTGHAVQVKKEWFI